MKRQPKEMLSKLLFRVSTAVAFLVSTTTLCIAQTNGTVLKGTLLDTDTKKPVEFATITLLTAQDSSLVKGNLTDTLGQFSLTNVEAGSYLLVSSSVEYSLIRQKVEVPNGTALLDIGVILLAKDTKTLDEVKVTAQKLAFQPTAEGITINMSNTLFKTSNNVIDVLKKSPSIDVKQDGSLSMRNAITPKVLINGRDVPMSAEELKNYLNTLKPDEVESIEVISNPSAKYDAEYKGVVNIRLKSDKDLGLTGSVSTTLQQQTYTSSSNNLSLIYKTKKVAYTARGGYSSMGYFEDAIFDQLLANGDRLYTSLYVPTRNKNADIMLGVDYYVSKKQIIGGQFRYFQNNQNSLFTYDIKRSNAEKLLQSIISTSNVITKNNNYSGNVYYEGNFKHGVLSFASSLVRYDNTQNQSIANKEATSSTYILGDFGTVTRIVSSQLDYSPTLKKGKLDIGTKVSNTKIDNDTKYQNQLNGVWTIDNTNSNAFLYNEKTLAAYMSYSGALKKITYMVGLRTENTTTEGNSITLNTITNRNYMKWLPSVSLNIPINTNNNISFSYSKRITRPSFSALNPYIYIGGPYTSYGGNQYLIPITNNAYSISYYVKKLSFTTNFGINYDDIQQVPSYNSTTNKTSYIYQNLSSNRYRGIEIGIPITATKWWTMQYNFKYYENDYNVVINQEKVKTLIHYTGLETYQAFKLPHNYNLSLSALWQKGGGTALFDLEPKGYVNLGLQKTFFKNFNTTLNINDLFHTYIVKAKSIRPDIINTANINKFSTRYISLQVTYTFGKSLYNAKQIKNSSQEEENRARK